jgi:flagellar L-ring protein precursor FlgH
MNKPFWSCFKGRLLALVVGGLASGVAPADSIWRDDVARPMFGDKRAGSVGDIVTIIVQETSTTSKDANTKGAKTSSADLSMASFLYGPSAGGFLTKAGKYPAVKYDAKNNFDGSAAVGSSEKITARISVRVVDVLPNRHLVIEGTRQTSFSGETQDVVLRGTVRPEDISSDNTIFSYNVADASIKFVSRGVVTDGQKKGWFNRIMDKVNPF